MALIKCKMCGGDLLLVEGQSVAECEYCGSRQTVPAADNERKLTLFARANRLRFACEFDKAAGIYESVVTDFPEEAEAYWGLVLCKYGIEYVDDPGTGKKIPTCHRSSFDSIMADSDFEQALENADPVARKVYRDEAKQIEEIRKGIIEVSGKEDPYDIFICYKETDSSGERTLDSVLAQDIYDALTEKGYRVFFARISLEDKLGQEYEPYIFAALNSAKIMLAMGTDYEYYNAVWVKNEWSRFLKLMEKDKTKHLIPCYKGIDAYDMPREFARLQAQDLGKLGAIQDLIRGIEKLLPIKGNSTAALQQVGFGGPGVESLMRRARLYLDNEEWDEAAQTFDKVLDMDVENVDAHVGKLCAGHFVAQRSELASCEDERMEEDSSFRNAIRFGTPALKKELESYAASARKNYLFRSAREKQEASYLEACKEMQNAKTATDMTNAAQKMSAVGAYKNAQQLALAAIATAERMQLEEEQRASLEQNTTPRIRDERLLQAYQKRISKMVRNWLIVLGIIGILVIANLIFNHI